VLSKCAGSHRDDLIHVPYNCDCDVQNVAYCYSVNPTIYCHFQFHELRFLCPAIPVSQSSSNCCTALVQNSPAVVQTHTKNPFLAWVLYMTEHFRSFCAFYDQYSGGGEGVDGFDRTPSLFSPNLGHCYKGCGMCHPKVGKTLGKYVLQLELFGCEVFPFV